MDNRYQELVGREREKGLLETIYELVEWDESVCMPPGGAAVKADQKALLARLIHERATDFRVGELVGYLEGASLEPGATANVRVIRRQFDRLRRVPPSLVEELARESTKSVEAWAAARKEASFSKFAPHLKRMVALKRQEAEALGYEKHPYDALLDYYEPGCRLADVSAIFAELKPRMVEILSRVQSAKRIPRDILSREYPIEGQRKLAEIAIKAMGFDMKRGRLDISTHPFCRSMDPGDVRLTTRYSLNDPSDSLFSTIHEAGHGLYEQGFDPKQSRLPAGKAASFGIHESQSRLWENLVARSLPFLEYLLPLAKELFPSVLGDVSHSDFAFAVNAIRPSFIRTNADEVTYNLHIILRVELETLLLTGHLSVDEIPEAWNTKFKETFGIVPSDDSQGCLQDIHWAAGYFGYFPTYTLGNLYAAQFMEKAREQMPDMDEKFRRGDFLALKEWLNVKIHREGQRLLPGALCESVTGKPLTCDALARHFEKKRETFYGA